MIDNDCVGENYCDAVSTSLQLGEGEMLYFLACSLFGLFFIDSLLIDSFSSSYEDNRSRSTNLDQAQLTVADLLQWAVFRASCSQVDIISFGDASLETTQPSFNCYLWSISQFRAFGGICG